MHRRIPMRFTIQKDIFYKALARVQGIVEKRNTIPILSNVLIQAEDEGIRLTATDLEVGMQAFYPAQVSQAGKITVAAKKIFEIIKELPDQNIAFTAKENCWIEIRCGKALFNIVGLSPDEFPFFPDAKENNFLTLEGAKLGNMIDKTAFSMSHDESKYNLNGIYLQAREEKGKDYLRLVATDGHRLAIIQKEISQAPSEDLKKGLILPRKGVMELRKLAEEGEGDILLGFLDNNAVAKRDQTVVVMRLVDGDFPDYSRVVPQKNDFTAVLDCDSFLHALRRMSILSSEKSRGVKISFRPEKMEISSSHAEFGDSREDLEMNYDGEEIAIGFNARYLLDILQAQDSPKIRFSIKDNLSPGLLRPLDDEDFLAVVMPMRL